MKKFLSLILTGLPLCSWAAQQAASQTEFPQLVKKPTLSSQESSPKTPSPELPEILSGRRGAPKLRTGDAPMETSSARSHAPLSPSLLVLPHERVWNRYMRLEDEKFALQKVREAKKKARLQSKEMLKSAKTADDQRKYLMQYQARVMDHQLSRFKHGLKIDEYTRYFLDHSEEIVAFKAAVGRELGWEAGLVHHWHSKRLRQKINEMRFAEARAKA